MALTGLRSFMGEGGTLARMLDFLSEGQNHITICLDSQSLKLTFTFASNCFAPHPSFTDFEQFHQCRLPACFISRFGKYTEFNFLV
jgi:hypothetical protein